MIIKVNKKRFYTFFILLMLCVTLTLFSLPNLNSKKINIQIHNINEWISGFDLGYSSLNNITNDGSKKFQDDYNQSISNKIISFLLKTPSIVIYKFNSFFNPNFKTIYLDINMKNFEIILNDRKEVIKNGHAIKKEFEEVPGYLWFEGNKKRMSVRLKGILDTHWLTKRRMSLKIELKNGETVLGYNEFSIQKPRERQWPYNHVFEKLSEKLEILSTNSDFVNVIVNGEKWGIMLIEESLGKVYLDSKKKKESLIFKFGDEREWFEGWSDKPFYLYRLGDPSLIYHVYNLTKNLCSDEKLNNDFIVDNNNKNRKIISYVTNNIKDYNSEIFYNDKLNKAFYLSEIWGNFHNLLNNNTSYYFNPYSLKLDPIIRDQYAISEINNKQDIQQWPPPIQFLLSLEKIKSNQKKNNIVDSIENIIPLAKKEFLKAKNLFPVDEIKNTESLILNLASVKNNKNDLMNFTPSSFYKKIDNGLILDYRKLENLNSFDNSKPIQNSQQIKRIKDHIYFEHYTNGEIEIFNLIPDNIIINEVNFNGKNLLEDKIILPSYLSNNKSMIIQTKVKGSHDGKFTIVSSYKNNKSIITNKISLIKDVTNPLTNYTQLPDFFVKKENKYIIPSGTWIVEKDILLQGDLFIEPGAILKFSENVSLIIKGKINAVGTSDKKIIFDSISENWNGLYIYNASETSFLSNVIFNNTIGINEGMLQLTGGIVFYKSPVEMKNITFNNSKGEDALNIINSLYKIENVQFFNSLSDAFDSDYSSGTIINTEFENIGGDALDFSGSNVTIKNMIALSVKDKAISIGEKSNLNISDINFKKVGVGVASKDGSVAVVDNCNIEDPSLFGLMTYVKKKNYSYPSLIATNCNIKFSKFSDLKKETKKNKKYFRQIGSTLKIDDIKNISGKSLNVDLLYTSTIMKKKKIEGKCNAI